MCSSDLLFGFDLMENFDAPYRSLSIREFWRRWHISLSNWFRDYLYIPLGGNQRGERRVRRLHHGAGLRPGSHKLLGLFHSSPATGGQKQLHAPTR